MKLKFILLGLLSLTPIILLAQKKVYNKKEVVRVQKEEKSYIDKPFRVLLENIKVPIKGFYVTARTNEQPNSVSIFFNSKAEYGNLLAKNIRPARINVFIKGEHNIFHILEKENFITDISKLNALKDYIMIGIYSNNEEIEK